LVAEQRELRLELSSLKSPERVETEAREKLGMEMPGNDRIIPINKKTAPVVASGRAR
jgi:cell division protein FtsL